MIRALDEAGLGVESLDLVEPSLDDVFLAKTGDYIEHLHIGYHLEGEKSNAGPKQARGSR